MSDVMTPKSPLESVLKPGVHAAPDGATGVSIEERRDVVQLQLIARKDKAAEAGKAFARFLGQKSALGPLEGAQRNGLLICTTGPLEHWVFAQGRSPADAIKELSGIAGASVSLFDQSAGRCVIRLAGRHAVDVLAKGAPLDLQGDALPATGASHTAIGHIPALVCRRTDPPCHDISVPRSYAGSFITWLGGAALEYGYVIEKPRSGG